MRVVLRFDTGYQADAEELASSLHIALLRGDQPAPAATDFELQLGSAGLSLRQLSIEQAQGSAKQRKKRQDNSTADIRCDFIAGELRHRRLFGGGKNQMILKATGLNKHKPSVMDLTAGLGRDSYVLATAGARVTMFERQPIVAALLADGLRRLRCGGDEQELAIAQRLFLHRGDSLDCAAALAEQEAPDVIYLDPMFPERGKTAKVKKAMAFFHHLVGSDDDAAGLLPLALATARYRVVVKRPRHAPPLGDVQPGLCFEGKSTRFDIYPLKKMPG
ncbi:MAG: class I SAM-dependent methyltransferase [Gammaproteobacteria bacterium]|nr:class I SAM-dependent methyltransferase [Gammaproteobacteria bacterium]MBQ0839023.1 class I SAM-dependent methyltransferase [Gammaproteobacteria bacterium]